MRTKIHDQITLSVVLPCRNEEASLKDCLLEIKDVLQKNNIRSEIIVSDSSTDSSPQIARDLDVVLVKHDRKGYGTACLKGLARASGKYIFIADPDSSYDFREIPRFLNNLEKGYDLVIGNRTKGKIEQGATPWSHRYLGNPALNLILKLFLKVKIGDANCGMRAFSKEAYKNICLKADGWEFAQEMVIEAKTNNLETAELPINYYRRKGKSKLRSFPDGLSQFIFALKAAYLYHRGQAMS